MAYAGLVAYARLVQCVRPQLGGMDTYHGHDCKSDTPAERGSQGKETYRPERLSRLSLQHVQHLQVTLCTCYDGYDTAVPELLSISTA